MNCKKCTRSYEIPNKIPLVLRCGHTYCSECIEITPQNFRCTRCKEVETDSASKLTKNISLFQLMENCTCINMRESHFAVTTPKRERNKLLYECDVHGGPSNGFCTSHRSFVCQVCLDIKLPHSTDCVVIKPEGEDKASFKTWVRKLQIWNFKDIKEKIGLLQTIADCLAEMKLISGTLDESLRENDTKQALTNKGEMDLREDRLNLESLKDHDDLLAKEKAVEINSEELLQDPGNVIVEDIWKIQSIGANAISKLLVNKQKIFLKHPWDDKLFARLHSESADIWLEPFEQRKESKGFIIESKELIETFLSSTLIQFSGKQGEVGLSFEVDILQSGLKRATARTYLELALNLKKPDTPLIYYYYKDNLIVSEAPKPTSGYKSDMFRDYKYFGTFSYLDYFKKELFPCFGTVTEDMIGVFDLDPAKCKTIKQVLAVRSSLELSVCLLNRCSKINHNLLPTELFIAPPLGELT